MNKKLVRHAASFLLLLTMVIVPIIVTGSNVLAQTTQDPDTAELADFDYLDGLNVPKTDDNNTLINVAVNIINIVLGLLALIAVVIILIAGFEWMTAGGKEDQVKTAQNRLKYGLIGLAIIFLSYAIARFVISRLSTVDGVV